MEILDFWGSEGEGEAHAVTELPGDLAVHPCSTGLVLLNSADTLQGKGVLLMAQMWKLRLWEERCQSSQLGTYKAEIQTLAHFLETLVLCHGPSGLQTDFLKVKFSVTFIRQLAHRGLVLSASPH